jgi:hypothetical protein
MFPIHAATIKGLWQNVQAVTDKSRQSLTAFRGPWSFNLAKLLVGFCSYGTQDSVSFSILKLACLRPNSNLQK